MAEFFYTVLYRNFSNKKNKSWNDDGVLQFTADKALLFNTGNGKEVSKRGINPAQFPVSDHPWPEGSTLSMQNKEIQIVSTMKSEDFYSGKCFLQTKMAPVMSHKIAMPPMRKKLLPGETATAKQPRHNVDGENACVMPRPPANVSVNKLITDVVVDPVLSKHLRPHQQEGVKFMYECCMGFREFVGSGAILADDMGLVSLSRAQQLSDMIEQSPFQNEASVVQRVLIVSPATLVQHWKKEFKKWLGDERIKVFTIPSSASSATSSSSNAEDIRQFHVSSRIYSVLVTNYERIKALLPELKKTKFDLLVCDEGHRLKDASIKAAQSLNSLNCKRKVLLSGTPIQNDLSEFFALVDFVNPSVLGTMNSFKRVFLEPIMKSRQPSCPDKDKLTGDERLMELHRMTSLFVLRRSAEINKQYLPPKVDMVLFCELSPVQTALYSHLLAHPSLSSLHKRYEESVSIASHFGIIHCLRKVVNSVSILYDAALGNAVEDDVDVSMEGVTTGIVPLIEQLSSDSSDIEKDSNGVFSFKPEASSKLNMLDKLISSIWRTDSSDKIVIISSFTKTLDAIANLLKGRNTEFLRLDGSVPSAKRMDIVDKFTTHEKPKIFLLSTKSGGQGLTLISANRLVLYDSDWNPAHDAQAMARIWRDGQKKRVYIYRMITCGTIDERIFMRGICKRSLSDKFMDSKGDDRDDFTREELKDVFTLYEGCLVHDNLKCQCEGAMCEVEAAAVAEAGKRKRADTHLEPKEWLNNWWHVAPSNWPAVKDRVENYDKALEGVKDLFSFLFIRKET